MSLMSDIGAAVKTKLDNKVNKVTSTDNAIVRFDGTTGAVQNSSVVIDDNGNVGIGVTPSAWGSNIKALEIGTRSSLFELSGDTVLNNNAYHNGTNWIRKTANASSMYEQLNGGHYFSSSASGVTGGTCSWDNNMILDGSGNLGIGITPNPSGFSGKSLQLQSYFLTSDVNSHYQINNAYESAGWKYTSGTKYATMYAQDSAMGKHAWYVASPGTAGSAITWTSTFSSNSDGTVNVQGTAPAVIANSNLSNFPAYFQVFHSATNNGTYIQAWNVVGANPVFKAHIGGVDKAIIYSNGNFQSATNSYGSTSDAKLKENVVDTTPKLEKLMQVQVRNFNYIGQEDKQIGVVAQEIEQIFPGIVYETKDMEQVEIEQEDGSIKTEIVETGEVTKSVKYSVIYMMMLKGIQEQQEIINNLKTRIETLEGAK